MCSICRVAVSPTHDRRRLGILVHEIAGEPRDARAAPVQKTRQLDNEAVDAEKQRLDFVDGHRQLELAVIALGRHEQRERIGQRSQRAIDLVEERLPEAARHAVARQREQFADRAHADAGERVERILSIGEQRDRQRAKLARPIGFLGDNDGPAGASEEARRARGRRRRDDGGETDHRKARVDAIEKVFEPAEIIQAAGNFQQQ